MTMEIRWVYKIIEWQWLCTLNSLTIREWINIHLLDLYLDEKGRMDRLTLNVEVDCECRSMDMNYLCEYDASKSLQGEKINS